MRNDQFQNANAVFKGHLRHSKELGLDVSVCKEPISKCDVEKLYEEYFIPGLAKKDTQILQHKVFFELLYYCGRCGKEGLRDLKQSSFELCTSPDGK